MVIAYVNGNMLFSDLISVFFILINILQLNYIVFFVYNKPSKVANATATCRKGGAIRRQQPSMWTQSSRLLNRIMSIFETFT